MSGPARQQIPPEKAWWVIWFALLTSPFVMAMIFKNSGTRAGALPLPWVVALAPFAVGMVIRFVVLPKVTSGTVAFPLFIVGLAMCEMPTHLGIFLFPEVKQELFAATVFGVAVFVPTFIKRFYTSK